MIEAQSFQSLLQLAVAANVGFAAILTFQGDTLAKERQSLDSLLESAKIYRDAAIKNDQFKDREQKTFADVVRLRADLLEKIDGTQSNVLDVFRAVSLTLALIAFGFLVYASNNPSAFAGGWLRTASIMGNLPILMYMTHLFIQSIQHVAPIRRKRQDLDKEISKKLIEFIV